MIDTKNYTIEKVTGSDLGIYIDIAEKTSLFTETDRNRYYNVKLCYSNGDIEDFETTLVEESIDLATGNTHYFIEKTFINFEEISNLEVIVFDDVPCYKN